MATGCLIKHVVKVSFGMLKAIRMRESGIMIRQMATVSIFMLMEYDILVTGKMTFNMEKAAKNGQMVAPLKVNINLV